MMFDVTLAEKVFKDGFAPSLSDAELRALRRACQTDDPRLSQGSTTTPPPLMCVQNWPCEAGCATGYMGMHSDRVGVVPLHDAADHPTGVPAAAVVTLEDGTSGYREVGDVEQFFALACFAADQRLGEPAACRHFLNWFDDTPRDEMRAELARWCDDVLTVRPADYQPVKV